MIGFHTIPRGERAAIWHRNGVVRYADGPRRLFLFGERPERLKRHTAEPDEYLVIRHRNGMTEHLPGPVFAWLDPVEHLEITVKEATKIDANETLVIYRHGPQDVVRRIVRGPALFVPTPNEWVHHFHWHGADPNNSNRKIPNALQFTRLRVIPDQMYFDVQNVRTTDDALLVIKLMVFFELSDIEKMLDQTHDPISDFINALSADVVDFVGSTSFERFKEQTDGLNHLKTYPQLLQRAEKIGYFINKVVYRGYYASDALQAMHDSAIECRTRLTLEAETERQAQEITDLKLARESERATKRQEMEEAETRHSNLLRHLQHEAELRQQETAERQILENRRRNEEFTLDLQRRKDELALTKEQKLHEEQSRFFQKLRDLQVDLTRYLVAQHQNPDKLIRIDQSPSGPQLHLHERK